MDQVARPIAQLRILLSSRSALGEIISRRDGCAVSAGTMQVYFNGSHRAFDRSEGAASYIAHLREFVRRHDDPELILRVSNDRADWAL